MKRMPAYPYPEGNKLLIDTLNLQRMSSLSVSPLSDHLLCFDPCLRRPHALCTVPVYTNTFKATVT